MISQHKKKSLVIKSFLFFCIIFSKSWCRTLYQSQCVFRHGARAGFLLNIPPYDVLFESIYKAKESGLTTEGVKQQKAFGSYLRNKYKNLNPYFYTKNYYNDANFISVSTTNIQRTHQSVQALLSELYENEFVPIFTVPENADVLRVQSTCLNFAAEFSFQEDIVISYANQLLNESDVKILFDLIPNIPCYQMQFLCFILLFDQYNTISFHFDTNVDDNGVRDTLYMYHKELELIERFMFFNPHISPAQNIGFDLFNEIINHLNCNFYSHSKCSLFEQECPAGFCGLVLYSAHDTTVRSLAHQLGVLTEDNIYNKPGFSNSICFDLYVEDNNIDHTIDILYGYPIKNESASFGYSYKQQYIEGVNDINKLSINDHDLSDGTGIMTICNGYKCSLDDMNEYRNNRMPLNDGCCTLEGNSKINFVEKGCINYELTNDEIVELNGGDELCSLYRNICPQTACGGTNTGLVYAPALEKCVAIDKSSKESSSSSIYSGE